MRELPNLLEVVRKKRGHLLSYHRLLYGIHPQLLRHREKASGSSTFPHKSIIFGGIAG